jgi:hypothetical protein
LGGAGLGSGDELFVSVVPCGGWVDGEDHALGAVVGLLAIDPEGALGLDIPVATGETVGHRVGDGEEAGLETTVHRLAWVCEGGLRDGVVLLPEGKVQSVTNLGIDEGWVIGQGTWATDDDLVDGSLSKGKGNEGEGCGDSEHLVVVVVVKVVKVVERFALKCKLQQERMYVQVVLSERLR